MASELATPCKFTFNQPFYLILFWGDNFTVCAYNDDYRPLLGRKPEALDRPFLEVWRESAEIIKHKIEQYRAAGSTADTSIRKAAPIRVRPILMTQLTSVLGLLPLALNLGEGGDMLVPMAIGVIGGLLYSLLLSLFFLPAAYGLAMGRGQTTATAKSQV